jgi:uncharacterized protein YbcI
VATDPDAPASDDLVGGKLSAAISNAIVRLYRDYLGRGPTRARTSIRDDLIVVVMEDTLTKAERTLVAGGEEQEVMRTRASFQRTMKQDMIAAVEQLAKRNVTASMSANHIDPDLACEIFVLDAEAVLEGADGDAEP